MNIPFLLSIIATTVEMTACLICARYLWSLREATRDRSRRLLALGSLVSGLIALVAISGNVGMSSLNIHAPFLEPWLILVYLVMHIIMTLYPISVVQPEWLSAKRYQLLFLPPVILAIGYLFFTGRWTPLYSTQDIWANIGSPDVLLRLFALFFMVPYCLILLLLPYNYHRSSATFWWIINYCMGLTIICTVHILLMLTYHAPLLIALPILAALFYLFSTEYELNDRLLPSQPEEAPEEHLAEDVSSAMEPEIWSRVARLMDKEEVWRDPDLSLSSMARHCATNITSLNRAIQMETGAGFKDLLNTKRIQCVVDQLQQNPDTDIQSAFFNAGYRSRTTAWRNFKDIMGVSPTEYRAALKKE